MNLFVSARCGIRTYLGLVAAMLVVAGCGGGGNGGGGGGTPTTSALAPIVTNFQIHPMTPERANTQVRYHITATVSDPDNDLLGGQVELGDGAKTLTLTIDGTVLRGTTVSIVLVTNPLPPGAYSGTFAVVDAAGHRSNEVGFVVNIALGTMPEHTKGTRGFIERLTPAR
jgi:hypothetical protein